MIRAEEARKEELIEVVERETGEKRKREEEEESRGSSSSDQISDLTVRDPRAWLDPSNNQ